MPERDPSTPTPPTEHRHNIADDVQPGDTAAGAGDDSPGMPGGTLGTGGAREEDQ